MDQFKSFLARVFVFLRCFLFQTKEGKSKKQYYLTSPSLSTAHRNLTPKALFRTSDFKPGVVIMS